MDRKVIYAIGHSTRSIEELIGLLQAHGIEMVVDIRSIPKSRHCPQFNGLVLAKHLREVGISYRHMKGLGGLRHPLKNSVNNGWRNASFRGYADYMQTKAFQRALDRLERFAVTKRCALLCAEGMPWRCHRSLVFDALSVRKWKAFHIQSRKTAKRHRQTPFLRIKKDVLSYPL